MVEGALHTARDNQLVCPRVPLPPYIKEQGGRRPTIGGGRANGGVLLPPGVGLLLSLLE